MRVSCGPSVPIGGAPSVLGLTVGLGMLAKYSLLVFLPAIFAAMYLCHWRGARAIPAQMREHWRQALVAAAIACLVIWAGFRFSLGPVNFAHVSLPAPRFFDGLNDVRVHNTDGHASYILGERHHFGVWYFFPVTLAVKTRWPCCCWLAGRSGQRGVSALKSGRAAGLSAPSSSPSA